MVYRLFILIYQNCAKVAFPCSLLAFRTRLLNEWSAQLTINLTDESLARKAIWEN